jgi:hypothetical protein
VLEVASVEVDGSQLGVMGGWVVLREVICMVMLTLYKPMNLELSALDSILYPVEAHLHGFGSLDLNSLVGTTISCGVVCDKYSVAVPIVLGQFLCELV